MAICPFCNEDPITSSPVPRSTCSSKAVDARCSACKELAELDARIAETRQTLLDMRAQRLKILSDVNSMHDSLTKSFPAEILSNIFQKCLPDFETLKENEDRTLTSTPFRLSQVCRYWRMFSHSTPSLWNIMVLYIKESQVSSLPSICEEAQRWIGRSGALPLHVILKVKPASGEQTRSFTFRANTNYEQRLGYLHVKASMSVMRRLQALGGDLPRLPIPPGFSSPSYFLYPPNNYTRVSGDPFPSNIVRMKRVLLENIEIIVENLTHVDICTICLGDAISLLRSAPNLISCKFIRLDTAPHSDGYHYPRPPFTSLPFAQHTLEDLYIASDDETDNAGKGLAQIFKSFNFTSLKSLTIGEGDADNEWDDYWENVFGALNNHLRRYNCRLQSITLNNIVLDPDAGDHLWFTEVFEVLGPNLNYLDITPGYHSCSDYRIASLIGSMLGQSQFPCLNTLKLHVGDQWWIHILKLLLSSCSALPNSQQLFIWICCSDLLLEEQTGDIDPLAFSYSDEECAPLDAADIWEILNTMNHGPISTQIIEKTSICPTIITRKIVSGLRRVRSQMEAEERRKRRSSENRYQVLLTLE